MKASSILDGSKMGRPGVLRAPCTKRTNQAWQAPPFFSRSPLSQFLVRAARVAHPAFSPRTRAPRTRKSHVDRASLIEISRQGNSTSTAKLGCFAVDRLSRYLFYYLFGGFLLESRFILATGSAAHRLHFGRPRSVLRDPAIQDSGHYSAPVRTVKSTLILRIEYSTAIPTLVDP